MTPLDAAAHAMTTVATGGLSTRDTSFVNFSQTIHIIAIVFMIVGSIPFLLYVQLMRGKPASLWQDSQVRVFLLA